MLKCVDRIKVLHFFPVQIKIEKKNHFHCIFSQYFVKKEHVLLCKDYVKILRFQYEITLSH